MPKTFISNTWVEGPVDFSLHEASEAAPRTMSELMDKMAHDRRFAEYIEPVPVSKSARAHYEAKNLPLSLLTKVWGIRYTRLEAMEIADPTYHILLPVAALANPKDSSSGAIDIVYEG